MAEKVLLKDILFNTAKVEQIAREIHRVYPPFTPKIFVRDVVARFPELELKARITWIAECLRTHLPEDYRTAVDILVQALPTPNDPTRTDDDFGDFIYAPYGEYVAKNGCSEKHLTHSLTALREITKRFSAEDAIRLFINAFPKETLDTLLTWTTDPHYHVRRLCSEGTRPALPWSQKISIPVTAPLPLLDNLFSDPTRYVTRSVANHLNDISKVDPDLVIATLARWRKTRAQTPDEMAYITRHALRTLVKEGNAQALQLLGFSHAPHVRVAQFTIPKEVPMNTTLEFSFMLASKEDTDVIVDYVIYFQSKFGIHMSKKVFKLKTFTLVKDQPLTLSKRHAFKQFMTTRTLYPGPHELELQINGVSYGKKVFDVR